MNIFGAFSFGKLIKTFLPGFLMFVSLSICVDAYISLVSNQFLWFKWLKLNSTIILILSIPFSLILGIISNSIFFTFLTDKLIRNSFKKNNPNFYELENNITQQYILQQKNNSILNKSLYDEFSKSIDFMYFILKDIDLTKFSFLEDSYWYYLEFHQNLIIGLSFTIVAIIIWPFVYLSQLDISLIILILSILIIITLLIFLIILSIKSARLNYEKYMLKKLSLFMGYINHKE